MKSQLKPSARRRPVFIADFRGTEAEGLANEGINSADVADLDQQSATTSKSASSQLRVLKDGLRYNFPEAGPVAKGGHSDGYCYRIVFAAGRMERSYELVLAFLREEGYGELPFPADVEELRRFRLPPKLRHQLSLFGEDGYVHNPVKILFPTPAGRRGGLVLELYDELGADHLLKFHRR